MLADPHFAASEAIIEVAPERLGKLRKQNAFPRMSETPSGIRSPAPSEIGQHNAEIYGGLLGIDAARRSEFAAFGAI